MEFATTNGSIKFESLWRTGAGHQVPVGEMDIEHLRNTITYLEGMVDQERGVRSPSYVRGGVRAYHNISVLARILRDKERNESTTTENR